MSNKERTYLLMKELQTQRLILRPITLDRADAYEKLFVDYRVIRYLSNAVPWPYPEGGVAEYLKSSILPFQGTEHFLYGLFAKEHPQELMGAMGLWRTGCPEHRGFWLGHEYWGNGYMTEACEEINRLAFEELAYEKLIFSNAKGNLASRRVKEKTGAILIGEKDTEFVDPQFTVSELWELSKEAWESRRPK